MQKWLFIGVLGCLIVSCNNVNNQNPVPYVPVNYTLRITSEYPHFVVDNGYQTMTVTSTKLEREYLAFTRIYKEQWAKSKKRIRGKLLNKENFKGKKETDNNSD